MSEQDDQLHSNRVRSDNVAIALLQRDVVYLSAQISNLRSDIAERGRSLTQQMEKIDEDISIAMDKRVLHIEFSPVKAMVYGLVCIVMTAVIGAVVALVVNRGGG